MKTDAKKKGVTVLPAPYNGTGYRIDKATGKRIWYHLVITGRWLRIKNAEYIKQLDERYPL